MRGKNGTINWWVQCALDTESNFNSTQLNFVSSKEDRTPEHVILKAFPNRWVSSAPGIRLFITLISANIFVGNLFSILVFRIAIKGGVKGAINLMICVDQARVVQFI